MTQEQDRPVVVRARDPGTRVQGRQPAYQSVSHGLALVFRLLLGLATGLLGAIMVFGLVAAPQAHYRSQGLLEMAAGSYLGAWMAAGLLAFAAAQAIQLFYVGGDHYDDQRLWERMTAAERGAWQQREGASAGMALRLMVLMGVVFTLLVDLRIAQRSWRVEGAGFALLAVLAVHLVAGVLAVFTWRRWRRLPSAPSAAAAAPASHGRWLIEVRHDPRQGPALAAFFAVLTAMLLGIQAYDGPPRERAASGYLSAAALLCALAAAGRLYQVRHRERPLMRRLEIMRKTDDPLVLECTATLPLALHEVVDREWLARLAGYHGYKTIRTDQRWDRWLDVVGSPLWVNRHTGTVHFRFEMPAPQGLPQRPVRWRIQLENPPATKPAFEFDVPREVAFPEEF